MAHVYIDSAAGGGAGTGADWANAYTTASAAAAAKSPGDQFWVASTHSELPSSTNTITSPGTVALPCTFISVNKAGTVPPAPADYQPGAKIGTTGAFSLLFAGVTAGRTIFDGIDLQVASAANNGSITIGSTTGSQGHAFEFRNGSAILNTTNASPGIVIGNSGTGSYDVTFDNFKVKFGATGQSIYLQAGRFRWINTPNAIDPTGTVPTTLITPSGSATRGFNAELRALDLSAKTSGTLIGALQTSCSIVALNCKLGAGVTKAAAQTVPGAQVMFGRCHNAAGTTQHHFFACNGDVQTVTNVVYSTNGAEGPDLVDQGWLVQTGSAAKQLVPFELPPFGDWSAAGTITPTVYCAIIAATVPTNAEVWAEFEYPGDATSGKATIVDTRPANLLAAAANNTTETSSDWTTGATARAPSTTYAVGDVVKVGTSLFVCTAQTGATYPTSGSDPTASFAAATDGQTVTDGGVTWRKALRFSISPGAITLAQAGLVTVRLKVGKASLSTATGTQLYVNPRPKFAA